MERPVEKILKTEKLKEPVSFNGIVLEKASGGDPKFVPEETPYMEDEFSQELMKKIAISLKQGDPILLEGGTSLGKTKTVRHMAALLGWEVHYANLNGGTDVEDLMGRYIPNKDKKTADDPEYVFADGSITSGLRQEEGKTKIILLDEYNSIAPNIAIRVHEVLDALKDDGQVVLSEDASEIIRVSKVNTKIIALTNPPGKGYIGREPIDPAQLRRWVYQKLENELPEKTLANFTRFLSGLEVAGEGRQESESLTPASAVPIEEFKDIEGLEEILVKYQEFHRAAKSMLSKREIAQDQPQRFSFDDRMEPARVISYVRTFFRGSLTESFQEALRYYYVNKLESAEDRQKLDELIKLVEYTPKTDTRRRSLDANQNTAVETHPALKLVMIEDLKDILEQDPTTAEGVALAMTNSRVGEAMDLRSELITKGINKDVAIRSLAGVSNETAYEMRSELLAAGASKNSLLKGLMGCEDKKAKDYRRIMAEDPRVDKRALAISLVGCSDHDSIVLRNKLVGISSVKDSVAESMAGTAEMDAARLTLTLIEKNVSPKSIAKGLKGIGGKIAHNHRREFLRNGTIEIEEYLMSMVGVGDSESIQARKEAVANNKGINDAVLASLAGVSEDFGIRDDIMRRKGFFSELAVLKSIVGVYTKEADEIRKGYGESALLKTYYLENPVDNFIANR